MRSLWKHFQVAWLYLIQAVKMRLEYRADFFVECLAALLQNASGLLVLVFLFNRIPSLREWSRPEVFFIYGFSLLPKAFFDAFSMNFYTFSDRYIVQGEMDRLLLRPLSSLFQMMMEGISFDFVADVALGVAVVAYASARCPVSWTFGTVVLLAVLVLGAWGVLTGVFLALTACSFWTQDRVGLIAPVYNLLNFARYPLNIFHPAIGFVLTFVIPFGFVAYYPSAAFLGKGAGLGVALLTPLAGLLCLGAGGGIWRAGLRHYAGAGS